MPSMTNAQERRSCAAICRRIKMEQQQLHLSDESAIQGKPSSDHKKEDEFENSEGEEGIHWPLSGKPYVEIILSKTAVNRPYNMYLPKKMSKELPPDGAPAVLSIGQKKWEMFYCGANKNGKFSPEWRKFVEDNNLKMGDGIVLELLECSTSKIHFRVQIFSGSIPADLMPEDEGVSLANPILM